MPSTQPPFLLRLFLNFFQRLGIISDRLWRLCIRRVPLLQTFVRTRKCLSFIIGHISNLTCKVSKSSGNRPSVPSGKANNVSYDVLSDNVNCFCIPASFFSRQSLPLYHEKRYPDPTQPCPSTLPSTSQEAVSYSSSVTPMVQDDMNMSPGTSSSDIIRTLTEDDCNHDLRELANDISDLMAVTPFEYERYERNFTCEETLPSFIIPPLLQMTFTGPKPPNQWVAFNHPEGAPYFYDDSRKIPILTDVWLYDEDSNERLEIIINRIFLHIDIYEIEIPGESCLVLEFRNLGWCGYYFVNHARQCLFWLKEYEANEFLFEVKVKYTPSLVGHEMKAFYWCHNHLFPNIRPLPSSAILEIQDMLIHAIGDWLMSNNGVVSYKLEDLQMMLELVNKIQEQDKPAAGSIAIISRFLHNFYHERFLHLHGQKMARLTRNQSIHPGRRGTLLMRIVSPFLLYDAEVHLENLRSIFNDSIGNLTLWDKRSSQLIDEWKESTLCATVLLNANVAFLAIQSIDSAGSVGHRSNAQRASYFSILTSIGAIVFGLLLAREHSTSSSSFVRLLLNRSKRSRLGSICGLESLALMYSLPYALLMWGMVAFLVAFSFTVFGSLDIVVIVVLSITWFMLCSLFLWWISVSREG